MKILFCYSIEAFGFILSNQSYAYKAGYSVGYFIAMAWPFIFIGLVAFVVFKYWYKRRKRTTS